VSAPVAPPPVEAAPAAPAAPEAPRSVSKPDDTDDTAGPPILFEDVQAILDDMVRPALQGDGGDISLLKVEDRRIYVRLVGACSTCPSSIMTMKMGVEALLKEEFPQMEELIQVEA
jgi:Fe-S cluster biogenesis protein NfuA